jgi:deazaflavin-dependent oxidoreductase (nitroreductase family)
LTDAATDDDRRRRQAVGEQLASWGKVVIVETRGRVTGRPARAAVGYVEEPDGSLLVAAGSSTADWALNLEAAPDATVELESRRWRVTAEPLEGADHARAVRELILRYGTPAESLGAGPAFRLRPADAAAGDAT